MEKQDNSFKIIHPNAAGINIGSRSHMVAVDQLKENVREFGIYTKTTKSSSPICTHKES